MPRGTLNIRLSEHERRLVDMKARARGMPTGRYIRMKILSDDSELEKLVARMEQQIDQLRSAQ